MTITAERSFTGSITSFMIFGVMAGFLHGKRQQSGGVAIGQLVGWDVSAILTMDSTPPRILTVKMVKESIENTAIMS